MLHLLHVVSSVDPALGGVAESIVRRGEKLMELGHQVEVASLDDPNSAAIQDYPLPLHALGPGITPWVYSSRLRPWLRENCTRFDAVIVDGLWQYHGFATRSALQGTQVPYFIFPHGMLDPWFKRTYPLKHLKKWLFWPWAEYRVLRDAKAVFFTCEEECKLAAQSFWLYKANSQVVPFGTSPPPAKTKDMLQAYQQKFPLLMNKKVLLFLGRIHPKKGCDLLIEAFAKALKTHKDQQDLHLAFAGPCEPSLLNTLQQRIHQLGIEDQVHWLGMLKGDLKWGALHASQAFVLPSHQENFGIAVAEALGCGKPVLISDKVNIWREISNGHAGFVDTDTVGGTYNNLNKWLKSTPEQLIEIKNNAYQTFERNFTISAMAHGTVNAINNILQQQSSYQI